MPQLQRRGLHVPNVPMRALLVRWLAKVDFRSWTVPRSRATVALPRRRTATFADLPLAHSELSQLSECARSASAAHLPWILPKSKNTGPFRRFRTPAHVWRATDKETVAAVEAIEKDLAKAVADNKAMIACCQDEKFDKA